MHLCHPDTDECVVPKEGMCIIWRRSNRMISVGVLEEGSLRPFRWSSPLNENSASLTSLKNAEEFSDFAKIIATFLNLDINVIRGLPPGLSGYMFVAP